MRWKYRGQFVPGDRDLRLEVHIRAVEPDRAQGVLVADASLWNGARRIYELSDVAMALREA
jgi:hypothetical protein